jgi:ABC-type Fe3+ transport system substrate-binding protein
MTILLMTYDYFGKTSGLTSADILDNADYQKWFLETEATIPEFAESTGPLMQKMIVYGPSTYDAITVYEATAIQQAENAVGRYGDLRVYYPPAMVWSDHPFCILNADWVTPQKASAARLFMDFLVSKPIQELALTKYGFRPVDPSIDLNQQSSPFTWYAGNGFKSDLSSLPTVAVPKGDVLNTLLDFWSRNIQR